MADTTLGDFIALILKELASTFELTVKPVDLFKLHTRDVDIEPPEEIINLHVSDLELDLPAHLQLQADPVFSTRRLIVTLPSTLETLPAGRLGRIRITIKPEPLSRSQE